MFQKNVDRMQYVPLGKGQEFKFNKEVNSNLYIKSKGCKTRIINNGSLIQSFNALKILKIISKKKVMNSGDAGEDTNITTIL